MSHQRFRNEQRKASDCSLLFELINNQLIKLMKSLSTITIFAILAVISQAQMSFNLNGATYQINAGYYSLSIPVTGGVSPFSYSFQAYPATWIQVGNNLNIPALSTSPGGTWAIKVIVTDALGNKLQRSLVVKISNGEDPLLGDYPYDQTFSFSTSGAVTSVPTNSVIVASTSSSSSTSSGYTSSSLPSSSGSSFGSASSASGVLPLQVSGTGANVALPTDTQLDLLINTGDIVSIKQTIQAVIQSTLSCAAKTQYLNDFLGRIETFITIKQSQSNQLNTIYNNTLGQIAALKLQIANYTSAIGQLGIPGLQSQLTGILNNLQLAYNAYNAGNIDLTPYNLNITANLQSIANLTGQRDATNAQINADNRSLNDTLTLINSLNAQLAAAINNKNLLTARILAENNGISQITSQIDSLNANNVQLNNQINAINQNKTTLQANYKALQTQAQNVKNTIASYQAQQNQYQAQITALNVQITQISGNLDLTPYNNLQQTILDLQGSTPSLQQQIDYVKFNCFGIVNYTVSTLNGYITYTFGPSVFSTYVAAQYGSEISKTATALIGPLSNVTLTPTSILSNNWIQAYGQPFSQDLALINININAGGSGSGSGSGSSSGSGSTSGSSSGSGSGLGSSIISGLTSTSTPNFFTNDFACSTGATLSSGNGVVNQISKNTVTVTLGNKGTFTLLLGACSNVLLLNSNVPKIGSNIFWNGLKISANSNQVYSCLFV